ncbi:hypothetical protein HOLleu_43663 [Holothuria leucospilota]|uniref:Uncharacterized protein n=1 Tax=Holothuria leucospilota TaxID=206669 RepID=A0A9Q0YBN8_HOLLE|nr:hypothetical protein HOLleu_43663 [Holothuria leucospilota]
MRSASKSCELDSVPTPLISVLTPLFLISQILLTHPFLQATFHKVKRLLTFDPF